MDDFGVIWNRNGADKDIGVVEEYVLKEASLEDYIFPKFDEEELRKRLEKLIKAAKGNFRLCSIGFSMFERACSLRGMENLLMDMIEEPDFVGELIDTITDYNLKIIDIALEYDIDGFLFGDDWGQQSGLIMGPILWRKFIKPRMSKMYSRIKKEGKPEIYNIKEIKAQYGNRLTFWGGISTQRLLPFASIDEIKKVTKNTMEILGQNGGYIAAPTHAIPGDVPPENIIAMLDIFQNQ